MDSVTPHYTTLARMVVDFQTPHHRLEQIVEALNIRPALVINGRRHFDTAGVEAIHAELMKGATRTDKRHADGETRVLRK